MTIVQAYKNDIDGKLFEAKNMSIIQAYKSDSDGKLFEDKKMYVNHLRKLARERARVNKVKKLEEEREMFLDRIGQVKSIKELNEFIKDNWKWFWMNGSIRESWHLGKRKMPDMHDYVDVTIKAAWREKISNSHNRPRKGVENFRREKDKPDGYPGWYGRIEIKVRPPTYKYRGKPYMADGWGSSYFSRTPICTGSGGGGSGDACKAYSYELILFAADFPVMYELQRRQQYLDQENDKRMKVWKSLGGTHPVTPVTEIPEDWVCPDPLTVQDELIPYIW